VKKIAAILLFFVFSTLALASVQAEDYRLRPGDVLAIDVWGHDEFQQKAAAAGASAGFTIRPDGKISFPLVGEIQAAGLTPAALTSLISAGLSLYLKDPQVTVNIVKFHTVRVYVLGEVARPGMYELEKQHNLLDAIGAAGGYTKEAAKRNVFVIHKDKINEPAKANLLDLLTKGDMSQNCALQEGDVVYLTCNGRIDFGRDIMPWLTIGYYVTYIKKN